MKAMFVAKVMFPTAGNFPMKIFILLLKRAIKSIFGDSLTDIIKIIGLPQKKTWFSDNFNVFPKSATFVG
jgi:hypothetical protein